MAPIQARKKRCARRGPAARRTRGSVSANTAKSQQAAVKRQIARSEDIKVRLGWPNLGKPFDRTVQL